MRSRLHVSLVVLLVLNLFSARLSAAAPRVTTLRVPDGGIQPRAAVDVKGIVHLVYFKGDPAAGDVFYARSETGGDRWSAPLRVNSVPASVIALGSIRGAQLTLGKNGRVHVAWMGSAKAAPKAPGDQAPMLYSRLNDAGDAFEPQRNLMTQSAGLDGGGTVAANGAGQVFVVWQGVRAGEQPAEENRRVWAARSDDDGKTFATDEALSKPGLCACCGMRALAVGERGLLVLYRALRAGTNRDMYLLTCDNAKGSTATARKVGLWKSQVCPMSSCDLAGHPDGPPTLLAFESQGQVYLGDALGGAAAAQPMPGEGKNRKHPAIALSSQGETCVAWTEGTNWGQGGSVAWQLFTKEGKPIEGAAGRIDGLPAWSFPAAFAQPDGAFVVVY
jgi:hypothetical protein